MAKGLGLAIAEAAQRPVMSATRVARMRVAIFLPAESLRHARYAGSTATLASRSRFVPGIDPPFMDGASPHTFSSAPSRSSIRSSACSSPTESRTSPSPMPSSARCSGVSRWCVVVVGCVIRLLASPRLLVMPISVSALRKRNAPALPPLISKAISVEPARHLLGDDRGLRMVLAARIDQPRDLVVAGERSAIVPRGLGLRARRAPAASPAP